MNETAGLTGLFGGLMCLWFLLGIGMLVGSIFLVRWVFVTFFGKAKEVYTDASKAALAEHGYQQGIAELNRRLAAGDIDQAEYDRRRKILEGTGPSAEG